MLLNIQWLNHRNLLLSRINYHRRSEFTERISHRLGKSDEIKDAFLSAYSDKLKHTRFNKFIIVAVLVLIILGSSLYFGIRHFNTSYERRNGYYVESIKDISSPAPTASPDTEPTPLEIIN